MTDFLAHLDRLGLTEVEGLYLLNDLRLISDHCIKATDIAPVDLTKANIWLASQTRYSVQQIMKP